MTISDDRPAVAVVCHSYTHSRRFPLVIGNIQGLRLRVPWTPAQLGVAVVSFVVLAVTRGVWGHLGGIGNGIVLLAVPLALTTAARSARIEGRSPWRFAVGWLTLSAHRWLFPARVTRRRRVRARMIVETRR